MKAYKGFNRDMTCSGYQFEEGKTYEHQGDVKLCESGFHAYEDPMDCLRYYDPCTSVYHEVEIDGVSDERKEDTKIVGKKIRIGARMSIKKIVKASIDFSFASCKNAENGDYISGEKSSQAASEYSSCQVATGGWSHQTASGDWSRQAAIGCCSRQDTSGDWSRQVASGDWSHQAAIGYCSCQASSGRRSRQASTDDCSRQAASGDESSQAASGDESRQETTGKSCVMMSAGNGGRAKGKIGSWIVLTEWEKGVPNVVARRIDGEEVKEDVWYTLKNGEFAEVES